MTDNRHCSIGASIRDGAFQNRKHHGLPTVVYFIRNSSMISESNTVKLMPANNNTLNTLACNETQTNRIGISNAKISNRWRGLMLR